ncbi:MAG: hypothetical protein JW832_02240 [Deltaproteobacteria bacterium]|nr:hypothetical protein [Deltaproteobacteria bacterium]
MANQCSTLNPTCMANKGIPCPALTHDKSCWEYDWLPELKAMSREQQLQWKSYLHDTCPRCPAFHPSMQALIDRVQQEL